jgi:hypothetical protein
MRGRHAPHIRYSGKPAARLGDVPQADVERRERVRRDPLLLDAHVEAEHLFPQRLDPQRVLAEERGREARLQVGEYGLRAAAAEHQAVAQALHSFIGSDVGDDQLLVGVVPRHGLRCRHGEDAAVDRGDFHTIPEGPDSQSTTKATAYAAASASANTTKPRTMVFGMPISSR